MKPQSILVAGAFAQCSLAMLAIVAVAVGLLAAVGCMVEGVCAGVQFEREET